MYMLTEQTDSAGNTYYAIPWGPNTGDVQHITIDRFGRKIADWGAPPTAIPGQYGQTTYIYDSQYITVSQPVIAPPSQYQLA